MGRPNANATASRGRITTFTTFIAAASALALLNVAPASARTSARQPVPTTNHECTWTLSSQVFRYVALYGVAASSNSDAWAVGQFISTRAPIAFHWNGTKWYPMPIEQRGHEWRDSLNAVAVLAPDDAWAVGSSYDLRTAEPRALIEHWDGTAWSIVRNPKPGPESTSLTAITPVPGSGEMWAVGFAEGDQAAQTLAEHWDGSAWTVVPSPSPGNVENGFYSVSAASTTDVWATGAAVGPGQEGIAQHWDGKAWTLEPSYGQFGGVVAAPSGGDALEADGTDFNRWNGSEWTSLGPPGADPFAISARESDGWTVGLLARRTWIAHWDGSSWSGVPSPNLPNEDENDLFAVAQVPGSTKAWAVGVAYRDGPHNRDRHYRSLILHHR